ncbi:uncharacterized protein LOC128770321 [Synchiropus splendidus]|uniref:uncharacterized protein LOC128770321 n=1 Tax=Synchiropus splendidus TaxID=270530 RepID=UPI00237DCA84|nr:uncharacterized protein LOC128770321 [Synchiropus splendidus]
MGEVDGKEQKIAGYINQQRELVANIQAAADSRVQRKTHQLGHLTETGLRSIQEKHELLEKRSESEVNRHTVHDVRQLASEIHEEKLQIEVELKRHRDRELRDANKLIYKELSSQQEELDMIKPALVGKVLREMYRDLSREYEKDQPDPDPRKFAEHSLINEEAVQLDMAQLDFNQQAFEQEESDQEDPDQEDPDQEDSGKDQDAILQESQHKKKTKTRTLVYMDDLLNDMKNREEELDREILLLEGIDESFFEQMLAAMIESEELMSQMSDGPKKEKEKMTLEKMYKKKKKRDAMAYLYNCIRHQVILARREQDVLQPRLIQTQIRSYQEEHRLEKKLDSLTSSDTKILEKMWNMLTDDMKNLVERNLDIDSKLFKYLDVEWERPSIAFMEPTNPNHDVSVQNWNLESIRVFWKRVTDIFPENQLQMYRVATEELMNYHAQLRRNSDLIQDTQLLEDNNAQLKQLLDLGNTKTPLQTNNRGVDTNNQGMSSHCDTVCANYWTKVAKTPDILEDSNVSLPHLPFCVETWHPKT